MKVYRQIQKHQNNRVNRQIQKHQSNQDPEAPEQPDESTNPETPESPEQPDAPTNPETPQQLDTATKSDMRLASTKPIKFAALEQDLLTLQNATEIAPNIEATTTPSIETESLPNLTLIAPIFNEEPYSNGTIEPSNSLDGPERPSVFESSTVVDVTQQATYTVANKNVVSVSNKGLVTAKTAGTTIVTVKYRGNEVKVHVTVTKQDKPSKPGKPEQPGKPDNPGKPEQPGKPNNPGKPEQPGKPDNPGKPESTRKTK